MCHTKDKKMKFEQVVTTIKCILIKEKMHTPVKILIDKNNNDNKIVDKFDLYQGNYDNKRHCFNKFIAKGKWIYPTCCYNCTFHFSF